jgi:hypothetical protein
MRVVRRSAWVLWLLLALLPLRGWAGAVMHLPGSTPGAPAEQAAMPCHGDHGADAARSGTDGASDSWVATEGSCTLCDLCHGCGAAGPGGGLHEPRVVADAVPEGRPGAVTPVQPDALFRPPRR